MMEFAVMIIAAIYALGAIYFGLEFLKGEPGVSTDTAFVFCVVFTLALVFVAVITFGAV